MLQKVLSAYCSPGRQLEIESTVPWGAVGGGLGWGEDLGNLLEQRLHSAEARIRMVAKVGWSVDVSSRILKLGGKEGQVFKEPELRQQLSQYRRNTVWSISIKSTEIWILTSKSSIFKLKFRLLKYLTPTWESVQVESVSGSQLLHNSPGYWCVPPPRPQGAHGLGLGSLTKQERIYL